MYAVGLVPLVKHQQPHCKQVWFADDALGCDELTKLKQWYDELLTFDGVDIAFKQRF